jgi:hypothetical protein
LLTGQRRPPFTLPLAAPLLLSLSVCLSLAYPFRSHSWHFFLPASHGLCKSYPRAQRVPPQPTCAPCRSKPRRRDSAHARPCRGAPSSQQFQLLTFTRQSHTPSSKKHPVCARTRTKRERQSRKKNHEPEPNEIFRARARALSLPPSLSPSLPPSKSLSLSDPALSLQRSMVPLANAY